jgi:hypothetical protein
MPELNLPRTEFLLHYVKKIEAQLIDWCKRKKYSQGDSYSVWITKEGKWKVSYSNDYPMQHGSGKEYILTEEEFKEATKEKR